MPPSPTDRTKPPKLPASIRRTKGPADANDDECPICHEPVQSEAPTLMHVACGRWFDEECLQEWIKSQTSPSCPICRGDLYDIWDLSQHDRFHKVVDALNDITGWPLAFHVRRTGSQAVDLIHAAAPGMQRNEVEKLVSNAIELSMNAIEFSGQFRFFGHQYPLGCAHGIYQSRDTVYKLDTVSVRHLWTGHRVLGHHIWFLLRLPAVPDVAIWLPVVTGSHVYALANLDCLKMLLPGPETRQRLLTGSTEMLSIPLSTEFLCDRMLPINEVRGDRTEVGRIRRLAAAHKIEHWCLVDMRDQNIPIAGICAIPWPRSRMAHAFSTQNYFEQTAEKTTETGGWGPEIEAPLLRRFVAQHALKPYDLKMDYMLNLPDGKYNARSAQEVREILLKQHDIHVGENDDLRLTEDEKWSTSAGLEPIVEVPEGSSDTNDSDGDVSDDEETAGDGAGDGDGVASSLAVDFEALLDVLLGVDLALVDELLGIDLDTNSAN